MSARQIVIIGFLQNLSIETLKSGFTMKKTHFKIPGYQILERIGEGTFGTVFRAKQKSTGRYVAVKMLRLNYQDNNSYQHRIARFHREKRLCAELHHPYIIQLIDQGEYRTNQLFAVFEYAEGENLKDIIKQNGSLSAAQLKAVMGQILEALIYAHQKGIVHRDLKPGNIIVNTKINDICVKVLDFGVGGYLPDAKVDHENLTLPSEILGTPSYAAPEQLRGESANVKSDLYSWGLIFLECLTGQPVFTGSSVAEIIYRQLSLEDIPLPPVIASHPIAELLHCVLAKNPRDRIGDEYKLRSEYDKIFIDDLVGKPMLVAIDHISKSVPEQTTDGILAGVACG